MCMLNVGSVADRVIKIETGFSNWQVPKVGLWTVLQYFDITLCSCIKTTYISSIFRTNRKCLTDKGSFLYSQTGCVNSATTTLLWWICLGKKLSKLNKKKYAGFFLYLWSVSHVLNLCRSTTTNSHVCTAREITVKTVWAVHGPEIITVSFKCNL